MASLVIAEHDNHSLKPATLNTVTAAIACGGDIHVLVAGKDAGAVATAAAQIAGVSKVLHRRSRCVCPRFGRAHGRASIDIGLRL
jgi:electron transfer flavoprotein alpha subunit